MGKPSGFPNFDKVFIMELFFPKYYKDFQCIAAACPDSCCKEWTVDVDPEAAAMYRSLPGDLGDRLRCVLKDTEDGTIMEIENNRCPMWRQDGLCRIQAELGHDALCKTCRDFPRLRHDYGDFVELGLELSCPEAARLIFHGDGEILTETVSGGETPDYDTEIMEILKESRREALTLLENGKFPLQEALAILLLRAHEVQEQIDGGNFIPFAPEQLLEEAKGYVSQGDLKAVFAFFRGLEILTENWSSRLKQHDCTVSWTDSLRPLTRYLINRYWLQAISDWDLVCRVKLIIAACILVCALGGDTMQTAQLFSKEIENNPDNVEAILDGAYTSPALTDLALLSLLTA